MAMRTVTREMALVGAMLTTGLISGFFYAYSCSVSRGLALLSDAGYIEAMQQINATVRNGLFALSFFGAVVMLALAVVLHAGQPASPRFLLIALACVLYVGGGFLLTLTVSVPMNEELARVSLDAPTEALARAREVYEDPWNFWNGVRAIFSTLALAALAVACLFHPAN